MAVKSPLNSAAGSLGDIAMQLFQLTAPPSPPPPTSSPPPPPPPPSPSLPPIPPHHHYFHPYQKNWSVGKVVQGSLLYINLVAFWSRWNFESKSSIFHQIALVEGILNQNIRSSLMEESQRAMWPFARLVVTEFGQIWCAPSCYLQICDIIGKYLMLLANNGKYLILLANVWDYFQTYNRLLQPRVTTENKTSLVWNVYCYFHYNSAKVLHCFLISASKWFYLHHIKSSFVIPITVSFDFTTVS